jgi:hypothetical protein
VAIDMYLPSLPAIGAGLRATPSETQATLFAYIASSPDLLIRTYGIAPA